MDQKTLDAVVDVLPIDNKTEELNVWHTSSTIETHEALPVLARVNPVALGWVAMIEGIKGAHKRIKRINAITGPGTVDFHAATDQSFFVLGVMIEFSGNELTPSSPFNIDIVGINDAVTIINQTINGDIKDIRAGKDGQRNMVVALLTTPMKTFTLPAVAAATTTANNATGETGATGFFLTTADAEKSDFQKLDKITVTVGGIDPAYRVGIQLLSPGNPNFVSLVNGLMKHEVDGSQFSVQSLIANVL